MLGISGQRVSVQVAVYYDIMSIASVSFVCCEGSAPWNILSTSKSCPSFTPIFFLAEKHMCEVEGIWVRVCIQLVACIGSCFEGMVERGC